MQVRATRKGYYGHKVIEAGEVFVVKDGEQAEWFSPVVIPASTHKSTAKKVVQKVSKRAPKKALQEVVSKAAY